jgi:uncharacterized protein
MTSTDSSPTNGIVQFVKEHQVLVFVVLAYVLSWWPWVWYQLDPGNVDAPILPVGPLLATLIVLFIAGGWPALVALFRKITHWRVGWKWYAVVLLLPAALTLVAVGLNLIIGAQRAATFEAPDAVSVLVRFVFIFLWIGLGEEPGWRGLVLPQFLKRHTALVAALLVGAIHLVWHAPLYGVEYDATNVLPWGISVICYSIVICWIYLHTGGSILMPMLMHASNNTIALLWRMFEGPGQTSLWWIWCALWVATAVTVVAMTGSTLGRNSEPQPASPVLS